MKIAILSRYQNQVNRGVESVVSELSARLSNDHDVDILEGKESDSFRRMISGRYDVVMPMNGRLQSLKASLGRFISPYKLVIGGHSGMGRDDIFNIAVAKPDVFIALTNSMAIWARKWAWGSQVVKISNGIDLQKFTPNGHKNDFDLEHPVFLSVGALAPYKRHDLAIEAVSLLDKGSLVIIGEGGDKSRLNGLGQKLLKGRYKITSLSYEEMPGAYRGGDVFTLPSWGREAFGLVYLEAMACGLPVVAPDDSSRSEIVGEGGLLTNVEDINEYTKVLKEASMRSWGEEPRKQAAKFSWEKITTEYINCLEKLIKNA